MKVITKELLKLFKNISQTSISHLTILILFALIFCISTSYSQKPAKIKIIRANDLKAGKEGKDKIQRLIGDVILKHDSIYLYCDSAHVNEKKNSFDGFGNVHIKVSDTLNIFSDVLNYDGNTKIAELHFHVKMIDKRGKLFTEHLWYNRINGLAWYLTGGKIIDTVNTLTSKKGYYYTDTKDAFFSDSVVLLNPDYIIESDSMMYSLETEKSFFYAPTTITGDSNLIYCENGWYESKTGKSFFSKNAYIITKEQKLYGDSLYYDRENDSGRGIGNIALFDTVQNMIIKGNYGVFKRHSGYSFVTDSAMAVMIDNDDSLFLHADTLWILFDSVQNPERMLAYYKMKFYRNDMQGMCDSLIYNFSDSAIFLYKSPVLWSEENQLVADTIRIAMKNNRIDSIALVNSAFITSIDDSIRKTFNQVKGKVISGFFENNMMKIIKIRGNAESLYFIRDDDNGLIGINKTFSGDMNIYLDSNKIQKIVPVFEVEAHLYPPAGELQGENLKLKDFIWIEDKRPARKEDIFIW